VSAPHPVRHSPRLARRIALGLALVSLAASGSAGESASRGPLRAVVDRVVERPAFSSAIWGIEALSLRTGALLYARDENLSLTPASALKLVTTAAALDALGADATLSTTVETAARLDGLGRLLGDVHLVGRGDPMLFGSSAEAPVTAFDRLAEALVSAGIRRIEGRIVGNEAAFTGERRSHEWAWSDLIWYYGADASALVFNNSAVHVKVTPGERAGDPVMVDRNPVSAHYQLVVDALTSPAGSEADLVVDRPLGSNVIRIGGTCPLGAPPEDLFISVEDPARFAATVFAETLEARGIRVRGPVTTSTDPLPSGLRTLAAVKSAPMAEIVRQTNQPSHNLRAEMLLRLIGQRAKGEGSAKAGLASEGEFLTRLGVPTAGFSLHDGCGLAEANLVTAHGLVALLAAMDRHPQARPFRESLPLAGSEGTLRRRLKGTPAEGRLRAKSGFMRHTFALAGYAMTSRDEPIAFAILLNHHTGDTATALAAIDEIAAALVAR
jgi:D-alanyl-D-alanine carboxypeptidase/D-alanyl-D-alanine-endopeptidase (penicillin-binding protein 4)